MTPTKKQVFDYFKTELEKNPELYWDCGELNTTGLGENAQDHFGVMTEFGQTEIEEKIFDWAYEFEVLTLQLQ